MLARAARPEDYDAFTALWAQLGQEQDPPPRDRWVEHLAPSTIFLEEDGRLAAYNLSFAFGTRGDVRQVVVDHAFRRRGVGKQLMAAVAAKLRAAGCSEWRLEVRADNAAALALYRAVGMRPLRDLHVMTLARADAEAFAATASGPQRIEPVVAADDPALEAALDFGAGQLARWRTYRAHCPMVRAGHDAMTQIWHDFKPGCALLFPFVAPDIETAAHLLATALTVAKTDRFELELRQPHLVTALLAAGAIEHEHQIEMTGSL